MADNQICGVVMSAEMAHEARVVAALEGKSRSKLMRELLAHYLEAYPGLVPDAASKGLGEKQHIAPGGGQ